MTLTEAKLSAKSGLVGMVNEYINESLSTSTILHILTWRLNALSHAQTPTPESEAIIDAVMRFITALQAAAQPFFARIDAATTVDGVWAVQSGFNPRVVPTPTIAAGTLFYERALGTVPHHT